MTMNFNKIFVVSILLLMVLGVTAASASTVTVGSKTFTDVDQSGIVTIYIDDLPNGLSGYLFNITISDPNVANITSVIKPSWFAPGLWTSTKISVVDFAIKAVDFADPGVDIDGNPIDYPDGITTPGATNVLLATVNLKSKQAGVSTITITKEQIDSDRPNIDGGVITATIVPGSLSVPVSTGSIKVGSVPDGAKIFINSVDSGFTTPHTFTDKLVGSYDVYVTKDDYITPPTQTKDVTKDTETAFDFTLRLGSTDKGSIKVTSDPDGAEIFINGVDTGKQTPYTFNNKPVGSYDVYVTKNGYITPATQTKVVVKGKKTEFNFDLKRVQQDMVKVNILPNPLNLANKGYFIAFVTLPNSYKSAEVDASSVICEGSPALKLIRQKWFPQTFIAIFSREKLVNVNPGDHVKLTVIGTINHNGQIISFSGSDTITVIDKFTRTKESTDDVMKMTDDTVFTRFIQNSQFNQE